jgi:hypothetical protein
VGTVSGNGFHPSKAQHPYQFTNFNLSATPLSAAKIATPMSIPTGGSVDATGSATSRSHRTAAKQR